MGNIGSVFQKFISTKINHKVTQKNMFSYACILCVTLLPVVGVNKKAQIPGSQSTGRVATLRAQPSPSAATQPSCHRRSRCPFEAALASSPRFISAIFPYCYFTRLFSCLCSHNYILLLFFPPTLNLLTCPLSNSVFIRCDQAWP